MSTSTSEERFRLLADSAPVLIWVGGPDGKEFVNRAYLDFLGVDEAAVKARGWFNFVHPDDREGVVTAIDDATARQEGFDLIFRFRRADGEYRWVKSTGVPRVDASGRFLGHTGSKVDVTELKQAEQVLREADHRHGPRPRTALRSRGWPGRSARSGSLRRATR